ncbi:hypothetical protein HanPI659440_Chr05g0201611 [Helianthus annuus]|nr:hypothetical protein HanPI659440_Chr05g0201611 [Helianthus annuus]
MAVVFLASCLLVCPWIPRDWIPVMPSRIWPPLSGVNITVLLLLGTGLKLVFRCGNWYSWVCGEFRSSALCLSMKSHTKQFWPAVLWAKTVAQMSLQGPGLALGRKAQSMVLQLQWKAQFWVLKLLSKAQYGIFWCFVKAQVWVLWIIIGLRSRHVVMTLKTCYMDLLTATLDSSVGLYSCFLGLGFMGFLKAQIGLDICWCSGLDRLAGGSLWAVGSPYLARVIHCWHWLATNHGAMWKNGYPQAESREIWIYKMEFGYL